jgi:DNA-binding NtrC family response regulator
LLILNLIGKRHNIHNITVIILLDDEPDIVSVFGKVLQLSGYEVNGFTDPRQAREFFAENRDKCSLVITDLRMPHMNGIDFAAEVRKINPDVKLLLLTAFETASYDEQIAQLKFSTILRKPITPTNLKATVEKTLAAQATS